MPLKGLVDIMVSSNVAQNSILLNAICGGGLPTNLDQIPNGSTVTLQRGRLRKRVRVFQGDASECTFNFVSLNPRTARFYRIRKEQRFLFIFDEGTKVLRMLKAPVTRVKGAFVLDRNLNHRNRITMGRGLFDLLGIYNRTRMTRVVRGSTTKLYRIWLKEDIFNRDFGLTAANAAIFRLMNGRFYRLAYNQKTNTLTIGREATPRFIRDAKRRNGGSSDG